MIINHGNMPIGRESPKKRGIQAESRFVDEDVFPTYNISLLPFCMTHELERRRSEEALRNYYGAKKEKCAVVL